MAKRVQMDWPTPDGAIYVGWPTVWGNSVTLADIAAANPGDHVDVRALAVGAFREWARWHASRLSTWLGPLRGHDLACWCPLDQPCHADALLQLANE